MADSDQILEGIEEVIKTYGTAIVDAIKTSLLNKKKVATGNLLGSVEYNVVKDANNVSLQISAADYLKWIEQGRKKGKYPPIDKILKWVQAKGIKQKGFSIYTKVSPLNRQKRTAFAIAKGIKDKGIRARPIITPVVKKVSPAFYEDIGRAVSLTIGKQLSASMQESVKNLGKRSINIKSTY